MRITFDKFTLADFGRGLNGKPGSPYNMSIDGQRMIQVDDGPTWEHLQFRDRKNRAITFNFTAEREHASYGDCMAFIVDHNQDLPAIGELILVSIQANGATVRRIASAAALQAVKPSQFGIRSIVSYSFLLAEIKTTKI
jgi:hypothetical protein